MKRARKGDPKTWFSKADGEVVGRNLTLPLAARFWSLKMPPELNREETMAREREETWGVVNSFKARFRLPPPPHPLTFPMVMHLTLTRLRRASHHDTQLHQQKETLTSLQTA